MQQWDVRRYVDARRYAAELRRVFLRCPGLVLHASQPGSTPLEICGSPEASELHGGGFPSPPDLAVDSGWVWARSFSAGPRRLPQTARSGAGDWCRAWLGPALREDFLALNFAEHAVVATQERQWDFNWKLGVEAALESYHFRFAHARTIGGSFDEAAGHTLACGPHFRFAVPRRNRVRGTRNSTGVRRESGLRDLAFIIYFIFPNSFIFVNRRHCDWLRVIPVAVNRSRLVQTTLMPARALHSERGRKYGYENHAFTARILAEDSVINESQQANFNADPGGTVLFGGLEGALTAFHRRLDELLDQDDPS